MHTPTMPSAMLRALGTLLDCTEAYLRLARRVRGPARPDAEARFLQHAARITRRARELSEQRIACLAICLAQAAAVHDEDMGIAYETAIGAIELVLAEWPVLPEPLYG